jgi:hypothetical protein
MMMVEATYLNALSAVIDVVHIQNGSSSDGIVFFFIVRGSRGRGSGVSSGTGRDGSSSGR